MELQGRQILYSKKLREKYMEKKKLNLDKDPNNYKQFSDFAKQVIKDFITSIEEAIQNLIDSIKSLIRF